MYIAQQQNNIMLIIPVTTRVRNEQLWYYTIRDLTSKTADFIVHLYITDKDFKNYNGI